MYIPTPTSSTGPTPTSSGNKPTITCTNATYTGSNVKIASCSGGNFDENGTNVMFKITPGEYTLHCTNSYGTTEKKCSINSGGVVGANIPITDKGINDGARKTDFVLEGPSGTTYAFNEKADKKGRFINTIKSGTDCIAFTSTNFKQVTANANTSYGIAFKRVNDNNNCTAIVKIEFVTDDGATSSKEQRIDVKATSTIVYKRDYKINKENQTFCPYKIYNSLDEYKADAEASRDSIFYGCVKKLSGCGSNSTCYDIYRGTFK